MRQIDITTFKFNKTGKWFTFKTPKKFKISFNFEVDLRKDFRLSYCIYLLKTNQARLIVLNNP